MPFDIDVNVPKEVLIRIRSKGRITFAEFMEMALYSPGGGYYSGVDNVGSRGDFYTSPSAHPAFGALICVQAFQMWQAIGSPHRFDILELGAGNGLLCRDFISYAVNFPLAFREAIEYVCVDRSLMEGVERQVDDHLVGQISRCLSNVAPLNGVRGLIFSNELVDSFPVHRVKIKNGSVHEIYVVESDGHLMEVEGVPSTPKLAEVLAPFISSMVDGSLAEVNLGIAPWLDSVAQALDIGFLLTVDYGCHAKELYGPARTYGTLECFYKHTRVSDPYSHIGSQDLTAHVDFTSLMQHGERNGFKTLGLVDQNTFLTNLGIDEFMKRLIGTGLRQSGIYANRMGMLDILRPGGMGDFKVLIQGKGTPDVDLWGLKCQSDSATLARTLPVPLRTDLHTPIMEGRYPEYAFNWEDMLD